MENHELERAIGRLEGKMDSLIATLQGLTQAFDLLEKGRLSRLETNFATLQAEVKERARTMSLWTSFIVSIIVSLVSIGVSFLLKQ